MHHRLNVCTVGSLGGKKRSPMRLCDGARRTASSRGLTDVLISQFSMRNAFPPLKVCSAHGEYGRKKMQVDRSDP